MMMNEENDSKNTMDFTNKDTIYALGLYKRLSSVLGIWPSKNRVTSGLRVGAYIILQITTVSIFIEKIIVYGNCGTIQEIVDTITVSISSTQISLKCILICFQHHKFKRIVEFAINDWSKIVDHESRSVMLKFAHIGRVLFLCQFLTGVLTIIPMVLSQLPALVEVKNEIDNTSVFFRNIPLAPNCWVELTMPLNLYYLYWTSLALYVFCTSMATVSCNLLVYGLGLHLFVAYELLFHDMEKIRDKVTYFEQRKFIKNYVKRHEQVLQISSDLEDASTGVILSEVVAIIIVGCVAGVMLLVSKDNGEKAAMVVRLVLVFIQLYIYSYMGEKLFVQSDKIQDAVYAVPWYELSNDLAKSLQMIMNRSNYPFNITAGKFYPMNLMSFKEVVKSMFSFFSVLRLMLQN